MMLYAVGGIVVLAVVMGVLLKMIEPKVGIAFWIILSLALVLIVIAALVRIHQPDLGY